MSETTVEVPETREGWYVLHDCYTVDWAAWRAQDPTVRKSILEQFNDWMARATGGERGDTRAFVVTGQKAELMFLHYRSSPGHLNEARRGLLRCRLVDFLKPAFAYLSVIEVSLYEATALAHRALAARDLSPASPGFDEAFTAELDKQVAHLDARLFRSIPDRNYCCFYPMSKRRGEQENWYTLPIEDRRALMRNHGKLGHRFRQDVVQVISGSTGLDDWEWAVDLHADDPLVFKKLVYEMRFDPASARYAEFGSFFIGRLASPDQVGAFLDV